MGHDVFSKCKEHVLMLPAGIDGYDSQQKRKNHQYFFYVGTSRTSCEVHYSASKAAVIGLTKALAKKKWALSHPSKLRSFRRDKTAMNSHLDKQTLEMLKEETPLGVIGTTEDVAQMVGF